MDLYGSHTHFTSHSVSVQISLFSSFHFSIQHREHDDFFFYIKQECENDFVLQLSSNDCQTDLRTMNSVLFMFDTAVAQEAGPLIGRSPVWSLAPAVWVSKCPLYAEPVPSLCECSEQVAPGMVAAAPAAWMCVGGRWGLERKMSRGKCFINAEHLSFYTLSQFFFGIRSQEQPYL